MQASVRRSSARFHPVLAGPKVCTLLRCNMTSEAPVMAVAALRKPGCMIRAFAFRPACRRLQKGSRSHFVPRDRRRCTRLRSLRVLMEERAVNEPDFAPFARLQRSAGPAGVQQEAGF